MNLKDLLAKSMPIVLNLLIGGPSFFDAGLMLCNLIMAQGDGPSHFLQVKDTRDVSE